MYSKQFYFFSILLIWSMLHIGCQNNPFASSGDANKLEKENDTLKQIIADYERQKKFDTDLIVEKTKIIDKNQDYIRSLEDSVKKIARRWESTKTATFTDKTSVNELMTQINRLLGNNDTLALRLIDDMKGSQNSMQVVSILVKNMKDMKDQIIDLENKIVELNKTVKGLEYEKKVAVDKMNQAISEKQKALEDLIRIQEDKKGKEEQLATAYFVCDTKKNLLAKEIIEQKGLTGKTITKKKIVNSDFQKFNYLTNNILVISHEELNVQKIELIPSKPLGIFSLYTKDGRTYLEIKDRELFWSADKYLVIMFK